MNPRTLDWLGATAAAVAAALSWYLLTMEPGATSPAARREPAAAGLLTGRSLSATPPPLRRDSPDFERTLLERGKPWLDARGRDATGLIALWDLTGDRRLLIEAEGEFPNDPRICMAMIQFYGRFGKGDDASPWIDRLIAAEPDNPEGLLQKARLNSLVARSTDADGTPIEEAERIRYAVLIQLRLAAAMTGPRNDHLAERLRTAHEAALALGVSPGDAARLALERPLSHSPTLPALRAVHDVLMEELAAARASGSAERLVDIIHIGLLIAGKFEGSHAVRVRNEMHLNDLLLASPAMRVRDEMHASDLQATLLASLTSEDQLLPDGTSAASWSANVTDRREYLERSLRREAEATALLATASDTEITSYFHCFAGFGEECAWASLFPNEEPKK